MIFTADRLRKAREEGYSDDEIWGYAESINPKVAQARSEGYSLDEISSFFTQRQATTPPSQGVGLLPPIEELFAPEKKEIGVFEGISNAAQNAFASSQQAIKTVGGVTPEEAKEISKLEFEKKAREVSPDYKAYQDAEGWDAVKAFVTNPFEVTTNIVAEGLSGSLPALGTGLAAGAVGAAIGAPTVIGAPAGFLGGQIAGTFAGSLATEYGGKMLEELQNAGMDINNPDSITEFFSNQKLVDEAKDKALKRGVPVAAFDALSAGIGGKVAKITKAAFKTPVREAAAETAIQAALGGGGEVAGSLAAGEEIRPKDVFAEIVGEVGPGAAEIAIGKVQQGFAERRKQRQLQEAAKVASNLENNNAPLTAQAVTVTAAKDALQQEKQTNEQTETELAQEREKFAPKPTVYEVPAKEEFKTTFAKMAPESIAQTEQGFREELESEDADTRAFAQAGLDALAEFRAGVAPTPITVPPVEEVAPAVAAVTQPAAPAAPVTTAAPEEPVAAPAEPIISADAQVINNLRSVAENTANREQISALSEAGLVDIIKGQPVINEDGEALLAQAQTPLPRLTPAERVAEIQAAPPAPPVEAPAAPSAPAAEAPAIVEQAKPAPAEQLPTDASVTIFNYDERVKPIEDQIDNKIDELVAGGMTFQEADNSPEVTALYEKRFAMDRGAINSYRDIVNQAFADQGVTENNLITTPAQSLMQEVYAAPKQGDEGLISVVADLGQKAFDDDAATIKKLAEGIFKYRAEAEGLSPEGILGPQSALTPEGKQARVDEARLAAEAIHNQIKNSLIERPATQALALQAPAPAPTIREESQVAEAERPIISYETLNPRGKQASKILTSIGVDNETAAFVAQSYQDEAGEMGAEQWRDFILSKFEENGGVVPAKMRYSEDQEYYQLAFNVGPSEAATMVENAKFHNQQMAQAELEQNKKWRRKDEKGIAAQRRITEVAPEAQGAVVAGREVAPRPALEGRGVPFATPQAKLEETQEPPQLPANPRFAPLPEPQAYAILRRVREERRSAPRERIRGLNPKKIIGKTARNVLRYASRLNQTPIMVFEKNDFTEYDIAAILAEIDTPLLDNETIESLGTFGSRGRAARFKSAAAIGVPSTKKTSVETLVHEIGHTLTNDAISNYSKRLRGRSGKDYIDGLRTAINNKDTPEPVARLFGLYISALDQLGIMDVYGKTNGLAGTLHPDISRKRAIELQKKGKLRKDIGWSELYGLANVDEFVAQTFSSEKFRNLLKTLEAPTGRQSMWAAFVDAIKYILNLPNNTMAAAVIEASIDISIDFPKIQRQKLIETTQDDLNGFYDGLELSTYLLNNPDNNIADAKDSFRKEFGREPHRIAGQHALNLERSAIEREIRKLRDRLVKYKEASPSASQEPRIVAVGIEDAPTPEEGLEPQAIQAAAPSAPVTTASEPEAVTPAAETPQRKPRPTTIQRLIEATTGVKRKRDLLTINEKTALKDQLKLGAKKRKLDAAQQKEFVKDLTAQLREEAIRGRVKAPQLRAIVNKAMQVRFDNDASILSFLNYANKVIDNANYDKDLSDAKNALKSAKRLAKQKNVPVDAKKVLETFLKVDPAKVNDPGEFAAVLNEYMKGYGDITAEDYIVVPNADMYAYFDEIADQVDTVNAQLQSQAFFNEFARQLGREGITEREIQEILDMSEEEFTGMIAQQKADARDKKKVERAEAKEKAINNLAEEAKSALQEYKNPNPTEETERILKEIRNIDLSQIDVGAKKQFVQVANSILVNNAFFGSDKFAAIAKGQMGAVEAANDTQQVKRNKVMLDFLRLGKFRIIKQRSARAMNLEVQSIADTFRNIASKDGAPRLQLQMGMGELAKGQATANKYKTEFTDSLRKNLNLIEKQTGKRVSDPQGATSMGIAAQLIQTAQGEMEAEGIQRNLKLILEDLALKERSIDEDVRAEVPFIKQAIDEILSDSVAGILENLKNTHIANYEALMFIKDKALPPYKDIFKEHDELFNNQTDNYDNLNYLPIRYRGIKTELKELDKLDDFWQSGRMSPKQSPNSIKRQKLTTLPPGKSLDYNLVRNVINSFSSQIDAAYTNPAWQQIMAFTKSPEAEKAMGGAENLEFVVNRLNRLAASRTKNYAMPSFFERVFDTLANLVRTVGIGLSLGGYGQFFKQYPSQMTTTLANIKDKSLVFESMKDIVEGKGKELLKQFSIGERGEMAGGTSWTNQMEGNFGKVRKFYESGALPSLFDAWGRLNNIWLYALKKSDFHAAASSWLAYYRDYLEQRGISYTNWDNEAELVRNGDRIRNEAGLYAEQMVDMYQGSSDPTKMATLAQRGNSGYENIMKSIFLPFFSFVLQERVRIISDIRDLVYGKDKERNAAARGLTGTIIGMSLFHIIRRFLLPSIYAGGASMIYALLGVDMDEPDEEKQKEEANRIWRQFYGELVSNILVGGFGGAVETGFIDAINQAAYFIETQIESENVLNDKGEVMSIKEYNKERSPFYRYQAFGSESNFGMLDIMPGQIEQLMKRMDEMTNEEFLDTLTPEEKRVIYFAGFSELLYTMRLNDTDVARMIRQMNRDVIEQAKEREKAEKRLQNLYK